MAATLPNVRSQVACCQETVQRQAMQIRSAHRSRSVWSLVSVTGQAVEGLWLSRVTQTLALRCPVTALLPCLKDNSEPFEALEFAPALTEANVFHACPELSCLHTSMHRRHGERHLAEDISCRFFGLNKGIDARAL